MRPQDLGLTILGSHLRPPRRHAWSGGMVTLLEELGFSANAARAALARLAARNLIGRVKEGRLVYYELTPRAKRLLEQGDERIFTFGRSTPVAEVWTILWHDIPEQLRMERARLGTRLRFLGFGSIQHATWVAASDRQTEVLEVVRALGVERHSCVFVAQAMPDLNVGVLVAGAWDLEQLRDGYRTFIDEFEPYQDEARRAALTQREAFVVRTRLLHLFRGFPFLDPELPARLAGRDGLREHAVRIFDSVYAGLGQPADRHFVEVTRAEQPVAA